MAEIYYLSADCASGKTRRIIKLLKKNKTRHIVLVQPTLDLISETVLHLEGSNFKEITSNTSNDVSREINNELKKKTRNIIVITEQAFKLLPDSYVSDWYIILDDIVQTHCYISINEKRPILKKMISDDIIALSEPDMLVNGYSKCTIKCNNYKNSDISRAIIRKLSPLMDYGHCIVKTSWFTDPRVNKLEAIAWIDLSKLMKFKKVLFMANNFESSICYHILTNHYRLECTKVETRLQKRKFPVRDRLNVKYFLDESTKISGDFKKKNKSELNKVIQFLQNELINTPYYWACNNSDCYSLNSNTKITSSPRGINMYKDHTCCVFLASLKPSTQEGKLMSELFGINWNTLYQARELEALYQFVNRSILRNYDSDQIVTVYVFDKIQASHLSDDIEYINCNLDFKPPKKSGRARNELSPKIRKRFGSWFKRKSPNITNKNASKLFNEWSSKADYTEREIEILHKMYINKCIGQGLIDPIYKNDPLLLECPMLGFNSMITKFNLTNQPHME